MKLPELKERLKNKYVVRIVAGVLVIALAGTGVGATYSVQAAKNTQTSESTDSKDSDIDVNDILDSIVEQQSITNDVIEAIDTMQKSITETATVAISDTRIASALSAVFCLLDDVFLDVFCFVFLLVFFVAIFTSDYFITS